MRQTTALWEVRSLRQEQQEGGYSVLWLGFLVHMIATFYVNVMAIVIVQVHTPRPGMRHAETR